MTDVHDDDLERVLGILWGARGIFRADADRLDFKPVLLDGPTLATLIALTRQEMERRQGEAT